MDPRELDILAAAWFALDNEMIDKTVVDLSKTGSKDDGLSHRSCKAGYRAES